MLINKCLESFCCLGDDMAHKIQTQSARGGSSCMSGETRKQNYKSGLFFIFRGIEDEARDKGF